jgi:ABC-type nitrate/sulfonate/bicarbonate transport system permease component
LICVLLIWHLVYLYQPPHTHLIASPATTFRHLQDLFYYKPFWKFWKIFNNAVFQDIGATIGRTLLGFLYASVVGIIIGLVIGQVKQLRYMFGGVIDFFRSIPVTALIPAFTLLSGVGNSSMIYMVSWACFYVVCINCIYGTIQTNPMRKRMAKLFGASSFKVFTRIVFFDALPQIMVGLRIAISYALIVSVLAEMTMGSNHGIGQKINEVYSDYRIDVLFSYIFIIGIIGLSLNWLFLWVENKLAGWKSYGY